MFLSQRFLIGTPLMQPAVSPPRERHLYGHFQTRGDEADSARWKSGGPSTERTPSGWLEPPQTHGNSTVVCRPTPWCTQEAAAAFLSKWTPSELAKPTDRSAISVPSLGTPLEQSAGLQQENSIAGNFCSNQIGSCQVLPVQESSQDPRLD